MNETTILVDPATDGSTTTTQEVLYEFSRAAMLGGWWAWAMAVGLVALLVYLCVWLYRRDTTELSPGVKTTLLMLRLVTLLAIVFLFFGLQRRSQQRVVRTSEVAVLVDTSQSMALPAASAPGAGTATRSARASALLGESRVLADLAKSHRVTVYAFDDETEPRELETRAILSTADDASAMQSASSRPEGASRVAILGLLCLIGMGLFALASFVLALGGRADAIGGPLVSAAVLLVTGAILLGGVWSVETRRSLASLIGWNSDASTSEKETAPASPSETPEPKIRRVSDWNSALAAAGAESRIGDAIRGVLQRHDPATLAGMLLVTDGQANGGIATNAAASLARRSEVALYPVGVGSSDAPLNARIVDLDAPRRVYPGDKFAISAIVQGSGAANIKATLQLLDGIEETDPTALEVVDSREVEIPSDGTLQSIRFELKPETIGRRKISVRLQVPAGDQNPEDDARETRYEVVARKLRVLTIAGGPTREYQFVRNMLYRDESIEVDTWLQTGQPGMSQDADRLLTEFPATPEELFEYDAIVAFDPDWMSIPVERLQLMERWLAEQAGGLVLIGGPIYMPQWTRLRTDPRVSILAGMFPVELATRSPLLSGGREGGDTAFTFEFTPEARRADFLFLADDPQASFDIWEDFGGVYDYVGVKDAKAGSKVYAYFSDPTTKVGDALPVYLASQFYGAGKTYFQGSGEMWRLRGVSDAYFDSYYTKLIRWISEGRLLRDSNRGVLLVDNSRAGVGDTITVRAVLTDEQFEPLRLPSVDANLLKPDGSTEVVKLTPVPGETREGTYGGRFVVRSAGNFELRLTLGDALGEQVLRQSIQVRLPTVEIERPQRNDDDLSFLASTTGGKYLPLGEDMTQDAASVSSLLREIQPQPQTTVLPGTPDNDFALRRNASLLWLIATALSFEWVLRRLQRLV
ncbi:MAG: VWA domain-containing protein [Planctomycetaceae bacterium]